MIYLKIYLVLVFLNFLYVTGRQDVYKEEEGFTVHDLIVVLILILSGPIGTCVFGMFLICDSYKWFIKFMDYYIVKPKVKNESNGLPEPKVQKTDDVVIERFERTESHQRPAPLLSQRSRAESRRKW